MNGQYQYLRANQVFGRVAIFLAFACSPLLAGLVPYPVDRVVNKSELIVVAQADQNIEGNWTRIDVDGRAVLGRQLTIHAHVTREIRGHCDKDITIKYVEDRWLDYIRSGQTQLLFLRRGDDAYLPADARLIALPAVDRPGAQKESGSSDLNLVMKELGMVVSTSDETALRKHKVLDVVSLGPADQNLDRSLKAGYDISDQELRFHIMLVLLQRNDISKLGDAKELLNNGTLKGEEPESLAYSIGRLKNPGAVPVLKALLESPDPMARRAGAMGLRGSGGKSEVPALLHALDDSDDEVAIEAMVSLGDVTGHREGFCSIEKFKRERSECVENIRQAVHAKSNR